MIAEARVGDEDMINGGLFVASLVLAVAAFRWGYVACAVGAMAGLLLLLARGPYGRVWWVAAGAVVAPRSRLRDR